MSDTTKEILKAIIDLKAHIDARFEEQARRLDEHGRKLDEHSKRFDEIDKRFDELTKRVDRLENRVDAGFAVIAARLDEQRATVNALIPTRIAAVGPREERKPS